MSEATERVWGLTDHWLSVGMSGPVERCVALYLLRACIKLIEAHGKPRWSSRERGGRLGSATDLHKRADQKFEKRVNDLIESSLGN